MNLYLRIALRNIQKNRRLFIPQILSTSGLMAMVYIIITIILDPNLREIRGGGYLPVIMTIGLVVVGILTFVLTLYINSFLMKRRTSEFGLYNVLGLEKRHIGKIIFLEGGISCLVSLVFGSILGIVLYKLSSLFISNLLKINTILGFDYLKIPSLLPTILIFVGLFLFTFIINRIRIARMNPVELLASKHTGEKEPKVKWLLLILGLAALGTGYYLALKAENPLAAMNTFFIAVPLVVVGTYFLFVTGSIAILKMLKKNKSFFYTKKHMISVSGLLYRMKQNAVGLGSITILATCVVVMISTTISLYAGIEDKVHSSFSHDVTASGHYNIPLNENETHFRSISFEAEDIENAVNKSLEKHGTNASYMATVQYIDCYMLDKNNSFVPFTGDEYSEEAAKCTEFFVITNQLYKELTGNSLNLGKNEIAKCDLSVTNKRQSAKEFSFNDKTFAIKETIAHFPISLPIASVMDSCYGIVVSDSEVYDWFIDYNKDSAVSSIQNTVLFDVADKNINFDELQRTIRTNLSNQVEERHPDWSFSTACDSSFSLRNELYEVLGGLLFLGIIMSIVFIFATALIIYYKQISEGYEDRDNFQILQKVGLTKKEVRKTIKDQILLVFFLPLVIAAIHCAVAFPILTKLLAILFLASKTLFLLCTLGAFAVFTILYIIIYTITSNTYYKIVK